MEFLVLVFLIGRWSVHLVGNRLVGGFKKTLIDEENLSDDKKLLKLLTTVLIMQ